MIVIVTDSSACLTRQDAHDLGAIYVPMTYTLGGVSYQEGFIGRDDSYGEKLSSDPNPYTSQPALDRYQRTFRALRKAGFQILCLTLSSRLSGAYNNACACTAYLGARDIHVVDTRTTAIGLAFLAREARALINQGYTLEETAKAVESLREKVHCLFSVRDMMPLRRSGRLGPVRQSVGSILNIRPLLSCKDGAVVASGIAHGYSDQLKKMAQAVPEGAKHIAVQYISEEAAAQELAQMLEDRCQHPVLLRRLGPVLGIHLGATVLGAMWFDEDAVE